MLGGMFVAIWKFLVWRLGPTTKAREVKVDLTFFTKCVESAAYVRSLAMGIGRRITFNMIR